MWRGNENLAFDYSFRITHLGAQVSVTLAGVDPYNMKDSYGEDVEKPPSAASFKNFLLFLLSYISESEGRDALEKELAKLYAWAIQLSNPSPVVSFTGELDFNTANNIINENTPPDVGKFSPELRQYLQE